MLVVQQCLGTALVDSFDIFYFQPTYTVLLYMVNKTETLLDHLSIDQLGTQHSLLIHRVCLALHFDQNHCMYQLDTLYIHMLLLFLRRGIFQLGTRGKFL